jgi:folylpolyglutamate synthase
MAFSVFLREEVDVAVVEVGIGGTHDSTNIIPQPVVCGVTSLGYDHTDILGPTLSEIAWHKGGIFKEHSPALTVEQSPEALATLSHRARELGASSFSQVPPLSSYPGPLPELSLRGAHQRQNASLAAQLCITWLRNHSSTPELDSSVSGCASAAGTVSVAAPFALTQKFLDGLGLCKWAGRNQVAEHGNVTYYLDGAHTPESMKASAQWFLSEKAHNCNKHEVRVLLFNTTGHRDAETFLSPLMTCGFHHVIFCPNISHPTDSPPDHTSRMVTNSSQLSRCYANQQCLKDMLCSRTTAMADFQRPMPGEQTRVCVSVSDAVGFVDSLSPAKLAVLVTGSMHLVGSVMYVLGFTVENL